MDQRLVSIRRLPPAKKLYFHELAMSFGMFLVLLNLVANFQAIPFWEHVIFILFFGIGTYFGGRFLLLLAAILLISTLPSRPGNLFEWLVLFTKWYFIGYITAYLCAALYNILVFLYLTICEKKQTKISFTFDANQAVNIIRSPIQSELCKPDGCYREPEPRNAAEQENTEEDLSYNMLPSGSDLKPYTIVFIANPVLKEKGTEDKFLPDPIIEDQKLFYRSVDNALKSFENDEILGNKEILKRLRVITVFNATLGNEGKYNLADRFHLDVRINDIIVDDVLSPQPGMIAGTREIINNSLINSNEIIKDAISSILETEKGYSQIDLIFALSASGDYLRSSSFFTDLNDNLNGVCEDTTSGRTYSVEVNPDNPNIISTENRATIDQFLNTTGMASSGNSADESNYTKCPGRAAINVLECRQKTYIHEFAHAMSSYINGAITDEYADNIIILDSDGNPVVYSTIFYINKLEKAEPSSSSFINFVPTPVRFMKFNSNQYYSDLSHPTAKENWRGYFPERIEAAVPCTMDRSASRYRFDKFISAFIYNKLTAKFNRK